jgi:hypothetical protein
MKGEKYSGLFVLIAAILVGLIWVGVMVTMAIEQLFRK